MSDANLIQFRQYADEALRWGRPIQERKRGTGPGRACARLTQAAANSPPEHRTLCVSP